MKKITFFLIIAFLSFISFGQGNSVATADPFCAGGSPLQFPNVTGQPNSTEVGCLGTIPNAAYYYLTIDQPGDLVFTISQVDTYGYPIDVDFIAWGPFSSIAEAQTNISLTDCPTCPFSNVPNTGFYPFGNIVDCSYSAAGIETLTINNALAGQIYVVLITNYDGDPGLITIQQTSGLGTTSCEGIPVCGGNFYDSGGDTGSYSNNETNTTTIYPSVMDGWVTVDFTMVDIATGDILTVYNGPNATYPSLGTVTAVPASFTSTDTSGALTFVFTSNASGVGTGWAADVICHTPPTCGSTFYDSGGPSGNYGNNENTTRTFYPDNPGQVMTVTFTAFNVESGWDFLYVYDGPNATFPLLGTFSGTTIPGPFTSTHATGALTFVFTSDGSLTYPGWIANITCITLCDDYILTVTGGENCGEGTVDLSATATAGTTAYYWYTTPTGGTPVSTPTGNWTTPLITATTTYYVAAYNGTCESDRVPVIAQILPEPTDVTINTVFTPLGADSCNLQYAELTAVGGEINNSVNQTVLSQNFEGGLADGVNGIWTTTNNSTGGTPADAAWTIRPNGYYAFIYTLNSNDNSNFILTNSDAQGSGSNTSTLLTSPIFSLENFTSASFSYYHHYNDFSSTDDARVEISTDGGATWVTATPLRLYTTDQGNSNAFVLETINLSTYLGQNNLRIRFRYTASWDIFWAIDNILLTGEVNFQDSNITWTPTTGLYLDDTLTTPYTGGNTPTVYAAPDGSETYTATAQSNNGCIKTDEVTIIRGGKIWNGSVDNNWYVDANWTPVGIPNDTDCVVIPDIVTSNNRSPIADISNIPIPLPPQPAFARNLTIEDDGTLEIESGTFLEVVDWVTVEPNGLLDLKDSASLIQITDVITNNNTGSLDMHRTATLNPIDYIYWSSPVEGFEVEDISPGSNPNYIFEWQSTVLGNPNGYGEWLNTTGPMTVGKGYIVRGLSGTASPSTALFRGRPNNGIIEIPITRGNYVGTDYSGAGNTMATENDDNWNLIGNPYPSAISAVDFLIENAGLLTGDIAPIEGTIYLWRHLTAPVSATDPFYEDYVYNYNAGDYIAYNSTGSNPSGFHGSIAAGQAFFVLMDHNAPTPSNVVFNNTMRNRTLDNGQFYRQNSIERHRIWLDLINSNNNAISTLVGYVEGATNGLDRLFDGDDLSATNLKFYSIVDNKNLAIQGKTLPFNLEDIVPLGFNVPSDGTYTIAINNLDGLFQTTNQAIYLEDLLSNTIHDLKANPYVFTTASGTHNDRFLLRYTNETLGVNDPEFNSGLNIIAFDKDIKVTSTNNPINTIEVYDVLGRTIATYKDVNTLEFKFNLSNMSNGTFIVKATLYNGQQKVKKIVH